MTHRKLNILLVEDDEIDALNVRRAFRSSARVARIELAEDGREALDMLRAGEVETERLLILLDINMPRMDGIEFLRELRQDPELKPIPVVVLTTSRDRADRAAAYRHNVAGYMVKPVTRDNFTLCMQTLESYWSNVEFPE